MLFLVTLTGVFVFLSGWAMSRYAPEATSIGQVIKHASAQTDHLHDQGR